VEQVDEPVPEPELEQPVPEETPAPAAAEEPAPAPVEPEEPAPEKEPEPDAAAAEEEPVEPDAAGEVTEEEENGAAEAAAEEDVAAPEPEAEPEVLPAEDTSEPEAEPEAEEVEPEPDPGPTAAEIALMREYGEGAMLRIRSQARNPERYAEGEVTIEFTVLANGRLESVNVVESSGYDRIDRDAVEATRAAFNNPGEQIRFPAGVSQDEWTFRLTLAYPLY
jgi:TonB family protein